MVDVGKLECLSGFPGAAAAQFGDAPALAVAGRPGAGLSYRGFDRAAAAVAGALVRAGVGPGDRVVLWAGSCPAWTASLFGIWRVGAVAVPLPSDTPSQVVGGVAAMARAKFVVVGADTADGLPDELRPRSAGVAELVAGDPVAPPPENDGSAGLALLAFTSGSTAAPRAVELTHANVLANVASLLAARTVPVGTRFLSILPPAHLFELVVGHLGPLACGATVVYAGAPLPNRIVAAVREEQISHLVLVPALLAAVATGVLPELAARAGVPAEVSSGPAAGIADWLGEPGHEAAASAFAAGVRAFAGLAFSTVAVGGAACPPGWGRLAARAGVAFEVGYGLTEASPVVALGEAASLPDGSCGRPLPGVSVRVSDAGEILVAGPNVMRGYAGDPAATRGALAGGWLHTGDLGEVDASGNVFVRGRAKEAMVTAAGDTVYPEEIEPYYRSPVFAESCVAPFVAGDGNDRPVLCVVPAPGVGDAEVDEQFRVLRAAAPARLRIGELVVVGGLPRNALGKVKRRELAATLQRGGGEAPPPEEGGAGG